MELVLLQDIQNSYGSNWARIANTTGVREIQIGDRFREQGFGPGAEELEVAGVDISPVGGMSRLFFNRGGNATKPEVHRLGAVLEQVGIKAATWIAVDPRIEITNVGPLEGGPINFTNQPTNVSASAEAPTMTPVVKRKRGRPPGSKNKSHMEVALPAGFE